jgi:hypothetical protein
MKKILFTILFSSLAFMSLAQWGEEELSDKPSIRERIFTGGGFGASFSSYYSYVSVSPLIGYQITPKLAGGIQLQYRYTKYKQTIPEFSTNDYGISPFVRYSIFQPFFLHAEYEYLNYEFRDRRRGFNSFMAGGGLFQPMGRRAGLYALALYNFSYTESNDSPYDSPLILRVGITAGF